MFGTSSVAALKVARGQSRLSCRELREEIGVIPIEFIHIGVFYDPEPSINGDFEYNLYLVTDWSGSPRNLR